MFRFGNESFLEVGRVSKFQVEGRQGLEVCCLCVVCVLFVWCLCNVCVVFVWCLCVVCVLLLLLLLLLSEVINANYAAVRGHNMKLHLYKVLNMLDDMSLCMFMLNLFLMPLTCAVVC